MKDKEKYIGIFDSGVGGLTVVKSLLDKLPNENIVYLADSKHMPYGDKTNDQIIKYVMDDVKFLNNYELKAILIACNTADAVASSEVKQAYSVPVFGVIEDACKVAIKTTKNDRIGVIATSAAIKADEYHKQLLRFNPHIKVYSQACPFLVPLIEEGKFDIGNQEIRYILEDYLTPLLENDIDTLILGCTHYDLLSQIIKDMYPNLNLVSSSRCVIDNLSKQIEKNDNTSNEQLYFVSSNKEKFKEVADMIIQDIEIRQI